MDKITEAKREISKQVSKMVGYDVLGLSDLLSIITSPDVLPLLDTLLTEVRKVPD